MLRKQISNKDGEPLFRIIAMLTMIPLVFGLYLICEFLVMKELLDEANAGVILVFGMYILLGISCFIALNILDKFYIITDQENHNPKKHNTH